jgi:oligoribonuclease NrnB/cAMP/cGMP phosphodiesterase (DHH superfamily)
MKTTVIHHSADYDGLFCREIARKFLPADTEFIGWDFTDRPIAFPDSGAVYVLDLPVDRVFGWDAFETNKVSGSGFLLNRVIWIDHHKSSIESHPKDIPGYRIDGVAACRLAWFYFTAEQRYWRQSESPSREWFQAHYPFATKQDFVDRKVEEPLAVRLAGEYDIWDKRDERADVFQFGLRSCDLSEWWTTLLQSPSAENQNGENTVCALLNNGLLLQSYQQRNDAGMMSRSFIVEFEGLKFLTLTTARCNSLTFAAKDVPETGHDALMGFYYGGKRWSVSLYHAKHNTGIDLSKIAVKYGGGGHRGACGFQVDRLPFLK